MLQKASSLFVFIVLLLFIVISISLIFQSRDRKANILLLLAGISYLTVMAAFITYLSKDNFYFNSLYSYFSIGRSLQDFLILVPVSRSAIIRLLNCSSMLFIYTSLCFSLSFSFSFNTKQTARIFGALAVLPVLEIIIYDPTIYRYIYLGLYPDFLSARTFTEGSRGFHALTSVVNTLYLLTGVGLAGLAVLRSPKIRQFRSFVWMVFISYTSVVISYLYINFSFPDLLVSVSKVANYIYYKPLNLAGNPFMYQLLPYVTAVCLIINTYGIYKYALIQKKIQDQDWEILRGIDSASLTVRVFCHYMKNELLAIQSQTEYLEQLSTDRPELIDEIKVIEQRCQKVYDRLDDLHHNAVKTRLNLTPIPLFQFLDDILSDMHNELGGIEIVTTFRPPEPIIMADKYYFSQAVQNIIINAVEALEKVPEQNRRIEIDAGLRNKWIILSIRDNGVGIASKDLQNIFKPFFSSKSANINWGMGLSLCHSIIRAHEGKITVESTAGKGSTFHIILPSI
jgi:signal transduction histidine kinase